MEPFFIFVSVLVHVCSFYYISKKVPIYFSCWKTSPAFPLAWWWIDNDWMTAKATCQPQGATYQKKRLRKKDSLTRTVCGRFFLSSSVSAEQCLCPWCWNQTGRWQLHSVELFFFLGPEIDLGHSLHIYKHTASLWRVPLIFQKLGCDRLRWFRCFQQEKTEDANGGASLLGLKY